MAHICQGTERRKYENDSHLANVIFVKRYEHKHLIHAQFRDTGLPQIQVLDTPRF